MDELIECEGCRRHVRSTDARCPFCRASVTVRARPPSRVLGRVTRAALFYGASALGCAEEPSVAPPVKPASSEVIEASEHEMAESDVGESDVVESDVAASDVAEPLPAPVIEPDTPEEARAERADAEDRKRRERATRVVRRVPCCPPYGAPPFDFVA